MNCRVCVFVCVYCALVVAGASVEDTEPDELTLPPRSGGEGVGL